MLTTILGLFTGPLGTVTGIVTGAVLLFGVGFWKGDSYRGKLDAAAEVAAMAAWQSQVEEAAKAAKSEDDAALKNATADLQAQLDATKKAVAGTSTTQCLSPSDENALRSLWKVPHAKGH